MIQTKKIGSLEYLTAEDISVPHAFTTRFGGVSTGFRSSMNLAVSRGDSEENVRENLRILTAALDMDMEKLVLTRQTHSDIVRVVTEADCAGPSTGTIPNAMPWSPIPRVLRCWFSQRTVRRFCSMIR